MITDSKRWFRLILVAALSMTMSARAMTTEPTTWLAALSQVESGDNQHAVGKAGELSKFQITEGAWKDHCRCAFTHARDEELAEIIALKIRHANWARLKQALKREPTPAEEYTSWNIGLKGFSRYGYSIRRVPKVYRERAERFENLYRELSK